MVFAGKGRIPRGNQPERSPVAFRLTFLGKTRFAEFLFYIGNTGLFFRQLTFHSQNDHQ